MLKNNIEKYIDILESLPKNELKSPDGSEISDVGEIHRIYFGDESELSKEEKQHRQITDENEKKKLVFLSNLTSDKLYLLYNAFDLGKSYYAGKDSLESDIRAFGGEEKLIQENLEIIKNRFTKETGIDQLTGKIDRLVIDSLNGYIERFMWSV